LAGGALFGFVGLLLAVPVAASIGVLVRFGIGRYLMSPLYQGHEQVMVPGDMADTTAMRNDAPHPVDPATGARSVDATRPADQA
jgi:hypothetical protein